ncbi:Gfo/Idh/MocA family oxidoreductase, partial [Escherichia coli]|uniref:Gfo/Idh/MocA family oxidoreductase n=1 Tax=Escherichia coli TaxID=562 RepID=UPI0035D48D05
TLQGAWSPTRAKALPICDSWRLPYAASLSSLPARSAAVFVHSTTASPLGLVRPLPHAGVPVRVHNPPADHLRDAARPVNLAARKQPTVTVRFPPPPPPPPP